jgi:hypothetical protein
MGRSHSLPGRRRIRIDCGTVEPSIKPIAYDSKNALFADSAGGGENRAVIATIVESCKPHASAPFVYRQSGFASDRHRQFTTHETALPVSAGWMRSPDISRRQNNGHFLESPQNPSRGSKSCANWQHTWRRNRRESPLSTKQANYLRSKSRLFFSIRFRPSPEDLRAAIPTIQLFAIASTAAARTLSVGTFTPASLSLPVCFY